MKRKKYYWADGAQTSCLDLFISFGYSALI